LLAEFDSALKCRGKRGAKQGATVAEGQLLAGLKHGTTGSILGSLAKLADIGDGLLQGDPMGRVVILDGQRRHPGTSLFV